MLSIVRRRVFTFASLLKRFIFPQFMNILSQVEYWFANAKVIPASLPVVDAPPCIHPPRPPHNTSTSAFYSSSSKTDHSSHMSLGARENEIHRRHSWVLANSVDDDSDGIRLLVLEMSSRRWGAINSSTSLLRWGGVSRVYFCEFLVLFVNLF